jgi:hypothetical protein
MGRTETPKWRPVFRSFREEDLFGTISTSTDRSLATLINTLGVKVKRKGTALFLCSTKYHNMKMYHELKQAPRHGCKPFSHSNENTVERIHTYNRLNEKKKKKNKTFQNKN